MLTAPESNIALDDKQTAAIEAAKTRLSLIENEIYIAKQSLNLVNQEITKSTKERIYQEELLAKATEEVGVKNKEVESLSLSVALMEEKIAGLREEESIATAAQRVRENGLAEREHTLSISEKQLADAVHKFTLDSSEIKQDKARILAAKEAFTDAVQAVTWLS